jgi:hypothetical protein
MKEFTQRETVLNELNTQGFVSRSYQPIINPSNVTNPTNFLTYVAGVADTAIIPILDTTSVIATRFKVLTDSIALAVAIAVTVWLIAKALKAGADSYRLIALAALTATLDLIVFNKVGSPQYQLWLVVPVMLGLALGLKNWRKPTIAVLCLGLLTQLIYPVLYVALVSGPAPLPVLVLGVRNLLLIALLVWSNLQLGKLGKPAKHAPKLETAKV